MQNKLLVSRFKGDRDYVHGTDMLDYSISFLQLSAGSQLESIDLAFHRMAHRSVELITTAVGVVEDPVAILQYAVHGERRKAYIVESDLDVDTRIEYNENSIVADLNISTKKNSCELDSNLPFTDIEIWVAMTKALHQSLFCEVKGKWLFVRGKFNFYSPSAKGKREIRLKANFNNKLTRCEAVRNGCVVGEIFFSNV